MKWLRSANERHRMEGYLPVDEFVPHLEFGVARIAFSSGAFESAESRLRHIADTHPDAEVAPSEPISTGLPNSWRLRNPASNGCIGVRTCAAGPNIV